MWDNNACIDTWDRVAQDYNNEILQQEIQLQEEIADLFQKYDIESGSKIIELGSGSGHLSFLFSEKGYETHLLDFSPKALEKCEMLFKTKGRQGRFINADLTKDLPLEEKYKVAWNSGVLEHFDDEKLKEIAANIAKVDAEYFVFIVPNPKSIPYLLYRYKLIGENLWNVGKEYLRTNYDEIFEEEGLTLIDKYYMGEEYTLTHLRIFLEEVETPEYLKEMFEYKVVEENQKYLVAYIFKKSTGSLNNKYKHKNYVQDTVNKTTIFDLISEKYGEKNKVHKLADELNNLRDSNNELKNRAVYLEEVNNQLKQENLLLENKAREVIEKDNKLEESKLLFDEVKQRLEAEKTLLEKEKVILGLLNSKLQEEKLNLEEQIRLLADKKEIEEDKYNYLESKLELWDSERQRLENNIAIRENEIQVLRVSLQELKTQNYNLVNMQKNVIDEVGQISLLKPYRLAHALRRFKHQFLQGSKEHKKEYIKWIGRKVKKVRVDEEQKYNPLESVRTKMFSNIQNIECTHIPECIENPIQPSSYYDACTEHFAQSIRGKKTENTFDIESILTENEYKGIVVYPAAVRWQPMQRPHHILREFAKQGYLALFLEENYEKLQSGQVIDKKYDNVYVIYDTGAALHALQSYYPIVLCTWIIQMSWINLLPNKFIWYDVLDQIEFLSEYDDAYQKRHEILVKEADFVSYTADYLRKYVESRKDAKLMPNGVNILDFELKDSSRSNKLGHLKPKKIIGYYGAIEKWFDEEIVIELANKNPEHEIVLIGHIGIEQNRLASYNNIHLLGQVPYEELMDYARQFDVCIIPFKVNELTNCVSPVKFFEYSALGKPVVSTPIHEMKQFESDWVLIGKTKQQFNILVNKALKEEVKKLAHIEGVKLAQEHTWEKLVQSFMQVNNTYNFIKTNANLNKINTIDVYTPTFLDFEGYKFYAGGAERYLIDLAEICSKLNYKFNVYQYGAYPWVRKFKNFNVISTASRIENVECSVEQINEFTHNFYNYTTQSKLNIYSPFFICGDYMNDNSIGISHGVAWDNEYSKHNTGEAFWEWNKNVINSGKKLNNIVSVDTNTANWFQTIDYSVGKKIKVVPNYVDTNEFIPRDMKLNGDKIIISYPRRLYAARGLYLVLNILDEILERYPNVEFHFVGRGFEEDTKHVDEKIDKWGSRVKWYSLLPEEMPQVYQLSDIVLVPTLYSEGTSLSCLEAMASGNAVIATRVGGLTDLIIDKFNGRLIDLDEKSLLNAIEEVVESKEIRERYALNAIEVAKAFDKNTWCEKWEKILKDTAKKTMPIQSRESYYIKLYLDYNKVSDMKYITLIKVLLEQGHFVVIKSTLEDKYLKEHSYGRLQFENLESNNDYDVPDYTVNELESSLEIKENSITLEELISKLKIQ